MKYGKQSLSAALDHVTALRDDKKIAGVCMLLMGQTHSRPKIKVAVRLYPIDGGEAVIPIRFFVDRQLAIHVQFAVEQNSSL